VSKPVIHVKVLFFATLKERAGVKEIDLDIQEATTVQQIKAQLGERYPGLQEALPSALISINREYAFDQDVIPNDAEIAIFPPVSGGAGNSVPDCACYDRDAKSIL
jgi:molybdopterin converting factor subunit 1